MRLSSRFHALILLFSLAILTLPGTSAASGSDGSGLAQSPPLTPFSLADSIESGGDGRLGSDGGAMLRYRHPLAKGLKNSTCSAYLTAASDTAAPDAARALLLTVLADKYPKLSVPNQEAVQGLLTEILQEEQASSRLKARALIELARIPAPVASALFLSGLQSPDTALRSASCRALAGRMRMNRRRGQASANQEIFQGLKTQYDAEPSLAVFRALAMVGEEYSRSYLAGKIASQSARLAEVFRLDEHCDHVGLAKAALGALEDPAHGQDVAAALRYGLKEPDQLLATLRAGSAGDKALATRLLNVFPALAAGSSAQEGGH